ncbi:hypothetical protein BDP27DRAFT_1368663 [Rhodocollybia butyracea]|uniref:Uncharacterized protein n=1 Tax=Rhodocollybia butyracea TaxID=206335 RepID=A0A9P5PCN9_9AGAR|nr:hypothetical protein BDP27DRAFT_1368663 [Rhodocollybia butyracea]
MPRRRTASAIAKAKLTSQEKAEIRKVQASVRNRIYRQRQGEKGQEAARLRMAAKRASMTDDEVSKAKDSRKPADAKYYIRNCESRSNKARWDRIGKWQDHWISSGVHAPRVYKCRKGKYGLGDAEGNGAEENGAGSLGSDKSSCRE